MHVAHSEQAGRLARPKGERSAVIPQRHQEGRRRLHGVDAPEPRHSFASLLSNNGGVSIEDISRLVGHSSTVVTEKVYRKELRPVLTRGAEAMDIVVKSEANDEAIDRQLGRQVPDLDDSKTADESENPP